MGNTEGWAGGIKELGFAGLGLGVWEQQGRDVGGMGSGVWGVYGGRLPAQGAGVCVDEESGRKGERRGG